MKLRSPLLALAFFFAKYKGGEEEGKREGCLGNWTGVNARGLGLDSSYLIKLADTLILTLDF